MTCAHKTGGLTLTEVLLSMGLTLLLSGILMLAFHQGSARMNEDLELASGSMALQQCLNEMTQDLEQLDGIPAQACQFKWHAMPLKPEPECSYRLCDLILPGGGEPWLHYTLVCRSLEPLPRYALIRAESALEAQKSADALPEAAQGAHSGSYQQKIIIEDLSRIRLTPLTLDDPKQTGRFLKPIEAAPHDKSDAHAPFAFSSSIQGNHHGSFVRLYSQISPENPCVALHIEIETTSPKGRSSHLGATAFLSFTLERLLKEGAQR